MGYEKFVLDLDQCGQMHALARAWTSRRTARRSTRSSRTAPGITSSAPHTLANFETAFYRSEMADNNSFEQWELEGSLDSCDACEHGLEEHAGRVRGAADRRGEGRGLREWIERKKASFPDSNV